MPVTQFAGAAGEANRLTVSREGSEFVFRDEGAPLAAEAPCTLGRRRDGPLPGHRGACPPSAASRSSLGDGDDTATVTGNPVVETTIDGGPGADTLTGGAENDQIDGGPGPDRLARRRRLRRPAVRHAHRPGDRGPGRRPRRRGGGGRRDVELRDAGRRLRRRRPARLGRRRDARRRRGRRRPAGRRRRRRAVRQRRRRPAVGTGRQRPAVRRSGAGRRLLHADRSGCSPTGSTAAAATTSSTTPAAATCYIGGPGADRLEGGEDRDTMRAGAGNDRIEARGGGADRIDCGPGRDRARGATRAAAATLRAGRSGVRVRALRAGGSRRPS